MSNLLQILIDGYNDVDPRTKSNFLARSAYPLILIIGSYLYFCLKFGPRYMENRKPFELKNTLIVYNIFQIILSAYFAFEGTKVWSNKNLLCEPIDYTENPDSENILKLAHLYILAKLSELFDTVFFVLRKKQNQITFLHLFHHSSMVIFTWIGIRYFAGGHLLFGCIINSYVHLVMYTYYLIAALGPKYQNYLWWKEHITIMQMIQFGIIFVHNFIPLFTSCTYPKSLHVGALSFNGILFYLFGDFYYNAYVKNRRKKNMKSDLVNKGT